MDQKLTEGSVGRTLLRFSLPFLLSCFLQTFYGMADLYIIGQFCKVESTTAVSIGSQVMHMLTVMILGLNMGTVVVIGQSTGGGNREKITRALGTSATLFAALAAVLTLGLLLGVGGIINIMSTPEKAIPGTRSYLILCFLGIPFIVAYNTLSSIFRGLGDSRSPMYIVAAACLMNIGLDYLLIGGLDLGPAGAALGTVLSQGASVALALFFLPGRKELRLCRRDLKPDREILGSVLKIGLPVALQDGFIQVAFIVVTIFANLRGLEDAAAVGIVEKLIGLLFLVPSAMLQSVSALSAQNIGAGKPDRARKTLGYACLITLIWGLGAVVLMHFQSEAIIGRFTASPRVTELGCQYMKGYVWDCLFAGIHFSFSGFFCAWGHSGLSFLHNAVSIVGVRLPLSYWAARYARDSLFPMGLASTTGSALSVLICLGAYLWLRKKTSAS